VPDVDAPLARFDRSLISHLDEPVQRFFTHAIRDGGALGRGVRLSMTGRIKVGTWLPFTAEQTADGRSFAWRARVGWGPITPLHVVDRYADGAGVTEGRLLGRLRLFHAADLDTTRSAATRAALESVVFAPPSVLPSRGVTWSAETEDLIVGRFELSPEHPEVHARIDGRGALVTVSALRWGNAGEQTFRYIRCGCEVHAERRFGDLLVPSSLTVGWWLNAPRYAGPHRPQHPVVNTEPELVLSKAEAVHASGTAGIPSTPALRVGGSCLRATSSPACHPGARPRAGGRIDSASIPLLAITHAITEFEFHISPVPSSSRPHTGVGTCATTSRTRRARCSSLVSCRGLSTASAMSGMCPFRQRRIS
jgi:hypothetical protein